MFVKTVRFDMSGIQECSGELFITTALHGEQSGTPLKSTRRLVREPFQLELGDQPPKAGRTFMAGLSDNPGLS